MRAHRLAVVAVLLLAVMALAGPALAGGSAENPPNNPKPPVVEPRTNERGTPREPEVAGEANVLPFTGSDLTVFVLAGGLTVAVGAGLVRRSRTLAQR